MSRVFRIEARIVRSGCKHCFRRRFTLVLPLELNCSDARAVRSYAQHRIAQRFPPPLRVEIDRIVRLRSSQGRWMEA